MSDLDDWLAAQLRDIEKSNLLRGLSVIDSPQDAVVRTEGRAVANFGSNDYLGLAADSRVREAALRAIDDYGAGSGASRLLSGTLRPHMLLEERLAAFKETAAALSFSTGYGTAIGTIVALEPDVVILDKLCHACLVDGARLSGALIRVFPHNHLEKLESHLRWARAKCPSHRILVITESVFSMDGDTAPLTGIVPLKERFGAWLMVDEAHAVGVIGHRGAGLIQHLGLQDRVDVQMGTLGKAFGASGGYICGSRRLIDFLINRARSFIFSTAPMPSSAAAAAEAVRLLASGELDLSTRRLWENIETLSGALGLRQRPESAIVPKIVGAEAASLRLARSLRDSGFWVPAVRFPTVARGTARLRITVTATHTREQIAGLASALEAFGAC